MILTARVLVLSGVMAVGQVPAAFAGGSIVQSAIRLAQQAGRQPAAAPVAARSVSAAQGSLAGSSMSKRKKVLLALVAGLGVAGAFYAIDHNVLDNTPSSLGLRKD